MSIFSNMRLFVRETLGWRHRDLAHSYASLRSLLDAGIPIRQAVEMNAFSGVLASEEKRSLLHSLTAGNTLEASLETVASLPEIDRACLAAGERSGHLPQALRHLAEYHEHWQKIRAESFQRLLYPLFLLHAAAVLLEVPSLVTGQGNFLANVMGNLFWFYTAGIALTLFLAFVGKTSLAGAFFSLPVVGRFRRDLEIARFSMAFRHLYEAGVEIVESYRMACRSVAIPHYRERLMEGIDSLRRGETLMEALRGTGVFSSIEIQILDTGEKTGTIAEALSRIDTMLRERGKAGLERFSFWLTQGVHLGVLLWVATRILGFYSNYYSSIDKILK